MMQNIKIHRDALYSRNRIMLFVVFGFLYFTSAVYGMSYFFQNSALGDDYPGGRVNFERTMNGDSYKPFIYRQLLPILVNYINNITPPAISESTSEWLEQIKFSAEYQATRAYMPWLNKTFPAKNINYKRFIASVLILFFLIGYMNLLFALARELFPKEQAIALFAPIIGIMAFCSFGHPMQYIYDIPLLCLSAACFYLIYKQRFRGYLLVFLLACINKETAIFSLIFFAIWNFDKLPFWKFVNLIAVQLVIYTAVRIVIYNNFLSNPGVFLENNVHIILTRDILAEANLHKIIITLTIFFLLTFSWQDKPLFLKRSLWLLPIIYIAYIRFGFPHEYRVFFDIHPPLVLLATHSLISGTGIGKSPIFSEIFRR